ncbi:MAG: 23S rRNA pseudouridine(2604) synthase RluF [Gammaproteobacteria bacterium]|nr:23S rRNA pseudouridine(2604) synthase RluF [Gammaproteobacteria bacterium]
MSQQSPQQPSTGIRVNKFLSEAGYCSRREADKYVDLGIITINGEKVVMGMKVQPGDEVRVSGKLIGTKAAPVYIALNKPQGITCTTDQHIDGNIIDFVNYPERIFPIGRLDKPSEGLILLTNDGDIVNKILRAGNNHEKEYVVTVDQYITRDFIFDMGNGVPILETVTNKCKVTQTGPKSFEIILTQGLNRQIRRMCEHFGFRVRKLKRMRIMNLTVDNLATGSWRHLTKDEMSGLNNLIATSKKTVAPPSSTADKEQLKFERTRQPRGQRQPKTEKYAYTPPAKK